MTEPEPYKFQRSVLDGMALPPGHWALWGSSTVIVCCPHCGGVSTLGDGHQIAADGTISPSLVHEPCGWYLFAQLLSWQPPTS